MTSLLVLALQACFTSTSSSDPCANPTTSRRPTVVANVVDLSVNAGLGALTAALRARLAGRSVWPAFKKGALGGAMNYAGKRIIGTREPAFRLVGREVAALGASVVANGGEGRAPFASVILPYGPARFYVERSGVRVKVDLAGSVFLAYTATQPHAHLDLGTSLEAGTPIFTNVPIRGRHQGSHIAGVIALLGNEENSAYLAHELIHATQYDFTFIAWSEPVERELVPNLPAGRFIQRHFDVGANMTLWSLGDWLIPYRQRPWEHEAVLMTDRPWP